MTVQDIRSIIRESVPEIIGGLTVAIILAIASLLYTSLGIGGVIVVVLLVAASTLSWIVWRYRKSSAWIMGAPAKASRARSALVSFLEIEIPLFALFANVLLLMPEAQVNPNYRAIPLVILGGLAIVANVVLRKPLGGIGMTVLTANIVAAVVIIGLPSFDPRTWSLSIDGKIPYQFGERTQMLIAVMTSLAAVWIVGVMVVRHLEGLEQKTKAEIHRLRAAPGIASLLEEHDGQRYARVIAGWGEFLKVVDKQNQSTGDMLRHCVPLGVRGDILALGCRTASDVSQMVKTAGSDRHPQPAPIQRLKGYVRRFFEEPFLEVGIEQIDAATFKQIEEQLG